MLKVVKYGAISVGVVAVVAGAGVGGWMYVSRSQEVEVTKPGTIGLNDSPSPSASPDATDSGSSQATNLSVSNAAQGNVLGTEQQGTSQATPTPAPKLPGPSEFGQYEAYKDSSSAMYLDIVAGDGAAVAKGSQVTVNYRGWLTNGTEFDESYAKGKPFTFTEGSPGVITGWQEGVFGMKVGGKRRIIVPAALGYGANPPDPIPPNSMLIFDIELLGVQ